MLLDTMAVHGAAASCRQIEHAPQEQNPAFSSEAASAGRMAAAHFSRAQKPIKCAMTLPM
jgi:hypothetical protein